MDLIRTDIDARFQVKLGRLGLKRGTTIVAVITLIFIFVSTILVLTATETRDICIATGTITNNETSANIEVIDEHSSVRKIASVLVHLVYVFVIAVMLYGNIKGQKKLMLPYVYTGVVKLAFIVLVEFVGTLTLLFVGQFTAACIWFLVTLIIFYIVLFLWEVVRCRVLELDAMEQPGSAYAQQDPELPAYGDIQGSATANMAPEEKSVLAYPNNHISYE